MSTRRNAAEIREAVIAAAMDLLQERGPLTFRMTDLIKRCGVSESVVYRHFSDRDHIIAEALIATFAAQNAETRRLLPGYLEQLGALDPRPETAAATLAEWVMGDGTPAAMYKSVLRSRLDVAVMEFPEIAERVAELQREQDQLLELFVVRLREKFSNTGWMITSKSFLLLLSGLGRVLLVESLDAEAGGTGTSRQEVEAILTLMFHRFANSPPSSG